MTLLSCCVKSYSSFDSGKVMCIDIRFVNEPSRSFTVPGDASTREGLLIIESGN